MTPDPSLPPTGAGKPARAADLERPMWLISAGTVAGIVIQIAIALVKQGP